MVKRSAIVLFAAVALVVGACSDDDPEASGETTSTAPAQSTSTSAAVCEADDGGADELESLIVNEVPAGFEVEPDDVGDTGPSDLAKAARDDGLDDAEEALTNLRFRRGYQRLWSNDSGDQLIVFLYEFCDARGADGYIDRSVEMFFGVEPNLETFEVSGLPGAFGYRGAEGGEGLVAILLPTGPFDLQVVAIGADGSTSLEELTDRAESLAAAQVAALD